MRIRMKVESYEIEPRSVTLAPVDERDAIFCSSADGRVRWTNIPPDFWPVSIGDRFTVDLEPAS